MVAAAVAAVVVVAAAAVAVAAETVAAAVAAAVTASVCRPDPTRRAGNTTRFQVRIHPNSIQTNSMFFSHCIMRYSFI